MIHIQSALSLSGDTIDFSIASRDEKTIDARGLTIFPGLIDPHVHFRVPGMDYKEDWQHAAKAALCGGYTTVFDMPNTLPPTISAENFSAKCKEIDAQLQSAHIPLRYELFFGADKNHFQEIEKVKDKIIGIKVFMGCSTGNLVIDDDESLRQVFEIAARLNLLVAVHAEDEAILQQQKALITGQLDYKDHSRIRAPIAAQVAVAKAIDLTRKYGTKLYILHTSTKAEVELIKAAKLEGLPVFAEVTPHHLFLSTNDYSQLAGKAVVNPPLRDTHDTEVLWQAIAEGVIDTIGSDHAPHTMDEKSKPYGSCPSGMPGIETTLPLLLTAYHAGRLSLEKILDLTHFNPQQIFSLMPNQDIVLVDLNLEKTVEPRELRTKCAWSSFAGQKLRGWPVYTVCQGQVFRLSDLQ